jgi:hypothetical protein
MEVPSGPLASEKSAKVARGDPARVIHVPEEGRNSKRLGAKRSHHRRTPEQPEAIRGN